MKKNLYPLTCFFRAKQREEEDDDMSPDAILEEIAQTEAAIREEKQMMREKRMSYDQMNRDQKNSHSAQLNGRTRQVSHPR